MVSPVLSEPILSVSCCPTSHQLTKRKFKILKLVKGLAVKDDVLRNVVCQFKQKLFAEI